MKKVILILVALGFGICEVNGQANKPTTNTQAIAKDQGNVDFCYDLISCHQMLNSALNYNTQPETFSAFIKRADFYLTSAESLFVANKINWSKKLAPMKVEELELLIQQYKQFATKEGTLTQQELASATLWMNVVVAKNKLIVERLIK